MLRRGRPGRAGADHHGEAVRHRPGQRPRAQRRRCTRPSPRSRSSASTTSSARRRRRTSSPSASPTACSSRSGTATTSTTCRSTCPRRSSLDARLGLLRDDRRVPRHGRHPPVPGAGVHGDGAADRAGAAARSARRRTRSSARCGRSSRPRRARPVRRLPRRARAWRRDSETETFIALALRDRQLALGRRAVLPAHRQAHGRGRPHHLDRLPRAAQEHVPGRLRRRRPRPRPPHLRPGRRVEAVAVVLRQAARAGHEARQAEPAVRAARDRSPGATCSRPTSG